MVAKGRGGSWSPATPPGEVRRLLQGRGGGPEGERKAAAGPPLLPRAAVSLSFPARLQLWTSVPPPSWPPSLLPGRVLWVFPMAAAAAAVAVLGVPSDVADELLVFYFENRRRSGGGPVQSWRRRGGGGATLTFERPEGEGRGWREAGEERLPALLLCRKWISAPSARLQPQGSPRSRRGFRKTAALLGTAFSRHG